MGMEHSSMLFHLILVLTLAVGVAVLLSRLRLPSVIGLLVTGVLAGPSGLSIFDSAAVVHDMAEVGVVLLLFSIGMETSLADLFRQGIVAIGAGTLQMVTTSALIAALGHFVLGAAWPAAIAIGFIVALSSTAVVTTLLMASAQMESPQGRQSMAILVFQDLCVLPITTLMGILAVGSLELGSIAGAMIQSAVLVTALVALICLVVPRLLNVIVSTRSSDLFVLGTLLVSLGTAWVGSCFGLSMPLGAFLAGLVVAGSPYSHHAMAQVMPLRTVFNSIFFISVGMLVDLRFVAHHLPELLALLAGVIFLKVACTTLALRAIGQRGSVSLRTAFCLAQIGEFSFVLIQMAEGSHLLGPDQVQRWTTVAVMSVMITPLLIAWAPKAGSWLGRILGESPEVTNVPEAASHEDGHVVIAGFGINGRNLARVLRSLGIPYEISDLNGLVVKHFHEAGEPIHFGDAANPEMLEMLGIRRASAMVLAISDPAAARRVTQLSRQLSPKLKIVVRTRLVQEVECLYGMGADLVITDEMEASLRMVSVVLSHFRVPTDVRQGLVDEIFRGHYGALFHGDLEAESSIKSLELTSAISRPVVLEPGSFAVGHSLASLDLRRLTGASCLSVRRQEEVHSNPSRDFVLEAGDELTVFGDRRAVEKGLRLLRSGKGYQVVNKVPVPVAPALPPREALPYAGMLMGE